MSRTDRRQRRGNAATVGLSLVTLLGCTALVVDVGFLLSSHVELQASLDAAALAGVGYFDNTANGVALARAKAIEFAAMNTAGGEMVTVPDEAIDVGIINAAGEFVPSTDPTVIHAMSIDHTMVGVPAFFAPVAFGVSSMEANARSIARRFPGRGAGRVPCFLPIAIPNCGLDDPAALEATGLLLNSDGEDNAGWADLDANPNASGVKDALLGQCDRGDALVGEPVFVNNGVANTALQEIGNILNGTTSADTTTWDAARWGPQPGRSDGSIVSAQNYGRVLEGPIVIFEPDPGESCANVKFNQTKQIVGFTWAAVYDVGAGKEKFIKARLDLTNPYEVGTGGGGIDTNVLAPGGGSLVR